LIYDVLVYVVVVACCTVVCVWCFGGKMSDGNCDVVVMQFVSLIVWTIYRTMFE